MERHAQCHCASLRLTTTGDPILVIMCHCRDCQRRTGSASGNGALFQKSQVIIEGSSKVFEREAQAGRKLRFHFCPQCGTSLYWDGDLRPDLYVVAVGAFADPEFPPPTVSIYEESRHRWTMLPDGLQHSQRGFLSSSSGTSSNSSAD